MKWLLEMDEDIRTGFLLGTFVVTFIASFLVNPWLMYISFAFPILWFYTLIKNGKKEQNKQQNNTDIN